MWVSAGHMPGPGQGAWLEALGARLNYAGRGRNLQVTAVPQRQEISASTLCSRALYLSPLQGKQPRCAFPMAQRVPAASAPTSGSQSLGAGRRMLWRGRRSRGGPARRKQPGGRQAGPAPCRLPVLRHRRSYGAQEMSLITKATRVIFIFKKPTAQVARLCRGARSGTAAAPLRYLTTKWVNTLAPPRDGTFPPGPPAPATSGSWDPPRHRPDYESRHPAGVCALPGVVVLLPLSVHPSTGHPKATLPAAGKGSRGRLQYPSQAGRD